MDLITPGFLAAGLAAAAPVIIHLLFRRRARRIDLGTLRFLLQAVRDQAHRRKLRRWLLLAMRIAAILLLAILFARPFVKEQGGPEGTGDLLVAIDQSASMSVRAGDATRLVHAHNAATKVLQTVPEGTTVQAAYFDASGMSPQTKPEVDFSRRPTSRGSDYSVPLKWARDILWRSRKQNRRVVLITDLQRSGVRSTESVEFPGDVAIEVIDVGRAVPRNLAVSAVSAPQPDLRPGKPVAVVAEVRNTGTFPARDVSVKLSLSGGVRGFEQSQTVSVAAGGREPVRFDLPVDQPGLYRGSVTLGSQDEAAFDDRRFLGFETRAADRVLLVNGEPGASLFAAETYFLEMALRLKPPEATAQPITPFDPQTIEFRAGELPDLAQFSVVILANVPRIEGSDLASLQQYVEQGGQLVVFGGGQVEPEGYRAAAGKLLPVTVLRTGDEALSRVQEWDPQHALLSGLSDPQHGDLRSLAFRRILEVEAAAGTGARAGAKVLMRDQHSHPLVAEARRGKGRVLFFAMAADRDWGDWPTHRLFVPLIHQTLRYLTGRLSAVSRVQNIEGDATAGITEDNGQVIVRNADPRESDMARLTEAAFRKAYRLPEGKPAVAGSSVSDLARPTGSQQPEEFWELIIWALLVLLIAETFVANRTHS